MRNIETGRLKTRTNSCVGLMRTQAGIFATMHPHRRSGYKEANSESNLRELGAMTTYKQFYEKGVEIPYMQKSNISVNYKQKLHKYDPNALCNRLPVKFDNEPVPFVRFCAPRNISQYELGPKLYERRFLTHNQAFYPKWDSLPIGFQNAGIMGDFAGRIHVSQNQ
uniref:Uncharacterized protein n=1 Tax=Hanusia phi TaxID=3032 RepID=A0A7S0E2Y6_9CRYP